MGNVFHQQAGSLTNIRWNGKIVEKVVADLTQYQPDAVREQLARGTVEEVRIVGPEELFVKSDVDLLASCPMLMTSANIELDDAPK